MNNQPNNSKPHHDLETNHNKERSPMPTNRDRESELAQVRQEDVRVAKRDMKRLLVILLAIGLAIGAVMGVGVVFLLDRLDLSDPHQEDQLID